MDLSELNLAECCKFGLMHTASGRFLTVEVFNNEINVSGTALRKRQVWTMLVDASAGQENADNLAPVVYWLSPFGRLLSADKDGKVNCNATTRSRDEEFAIEFNTSGNGEIAIKSYHHGYYLNGNETQVSCFSKTVRWWALRLATHPQINIKNVFRNRFAHLLPNRAEIRCDLAQPWDQDSVFRLVQLPLPTSTPITKVHRYGQVAISTESGTLSDQDYLYLTPDGGLTTEITDQNMFSLEIKPGAPALFSFRHVETGAYLSAVGQGTLKTKSNQNASTKGREEMFVVSRAACQVAILANNDKFVSMKQGVEILANQRELNDTETFQLEYVGGRGLDAQRVIQTTLARECCEANNNNLTAADHLINGCNNSNNKAAPASVANGCKIYSFLSGAWRLRSKENKLWNLRPNAPVHHTGKEGEPDTEFEAYCVTSGSPKPGALVLKSLGSNQTLIAKKLGAVSCTGPATELAESGPRGSEEFFRVYPFVNRKCLIIQSAVNGGFLSRNPVQSKTKLAGIPLDCTGLVWEEYRVRHLPNNGAVQLYASSAKTGTKYQRWLLTESGLCLQPTEISLDQDLDELEGEAEPGTEFVFYFLGEGRCLIRAVNAPCVPEDAFCLLKAEPKGDVRPSMTGDISATCIWEI